MIGDAKVRAYTWLQSQPDFDGQNITLTQARELTRRFGLDDAALDALQTATTQAWERARQVVEGDGGVMSAGREAKSPGFEGHTVTGSSGLMALGAKVESGAANKLQALSFVAEIPGLDAAARQRLTELVHAAFADPSRPPRMKLERQPSGACTLELEPIHYFGSSAKIGVPELRAASARAYQRSLDRSGWDMHGEYVSNRLALSAKSVDPASLGPLKGAALAYALADGVRSHLDQCPLVALLRIDVAGRQGLPKEAHVANIKKEPFVRGEVQVLVHSQLRWETAMHFSAVVAQDALVDGKLRSVFFEAGAGMPGVLQL